MNEQFDLFSAADAPPPPRYFDGPRVPAGDVQDNAGAKRPKPAAGETLGDRLWAWVHDRQIRGATIEEAEQYFGRPLGVEWNQLMGEGRIVDAGLLRPREGAGYAKVFLSAYWGRRRV